MRNELDIQTLQRAKANAVAYYHAQDTDQDFWEQCIQDIDDEIKDIDRQSEPPMYGKARLAVMAIIILILLTILLSSCATLKGGLTDSAWIAQKLADNIKTQEK